MTQLKSPSNAPLTLPALAENYLRTINAHDGTAFMRLFADDALVDDNFREIRGKAAIEDWSTREIFGAQVVMELRAVEATDGPIVFTTKVDGNFDRTGLPDPVIIRHSITERDGKIAVLTCRLASG